MLLALRSRIPKMSIPPLRFLSSHPSGAHPNPQPASEKPTSAHYDQLITIAGQSRDFPAIHSFLTQRVRSGYFNTATTFKFLTLVDPTTLPSILSPLIETISALEMGYGRKNALDSLIACLSKSHPQHARYVLDEMLKRRLGANACTFYPLISSLSRKKQMADVSDLLDLMRGEGIPPDTTCHNYMLSALCHIGDLPAAAQTLNSMLGEGLEADSLTFDALVLGACRLGRFDGAVALVRRMEEEGVRGMYSTYAHVIRGMLSIGGYAEAVEFVRRVGGRDGRLDGENYGVLGRGLVWKGRWDEVRIVVREMEEKGLEIEEKLNDAYHLHMDDSNVI
ncbi:pentatricopeptide repeat-containing protein At2g40240, mitochondrial [Magnolia sinica]|uniref:pentatricopeptide repeat-containing protein At2g40240, mitochondrial n=1 Tax=Magnolia sinica TaxID=86752 RepID=UPI00265B1F1D|nr:pentatricopeptide repeat-containing protein At2g40240, mitochondrial [Magnolia sinica]